MPERKPDIDTETLNALQAAAKAAADDVIRSYDWAGTIEDADLLRTDESYLFLADTALIADLVTEVKTLRRALGGMLFAFDDGVGQEWSQELLDFARQTAPAVEFKP